MKKLRPRTVPHNPQRRVTRELTAEELKQARGARRLFRRRRRILRRR